MTLEAVPEIGSERPVGYVAEGLVEADNLVTDDEEFVATAEACGDATEIGALCQQTFELGVLIRRQAAPSAELLSFGERVQRFSEDVKRVTQEAVQALAVETERIADPEQGILNEAVNQQLGSLSEAIDRAFDENDKKSALHRMENAVRTAATDANEQAARTLRDVLQVSKDEGPLAELRATIVREVSAPFADLGETLTEVEKLLTAEAVKREEHRKGTRQGVEFEDAVAQELGDMCHVMNDVVTCTGNAQGPTGSKVGDHVVEIRSPSGAEVRIVFECKKRSTPLSVAKMRKELDEAAENRQAAVAVIVLSSDSNAKTPMPLWKLAEHRYAVVYADATRNALALRLAFQQARSDALATLSNSSDAEGLDVEALLARLAEARALLKHLRQIQSGVTKARKALEAIEENALSMETELVRCLDECEQMAKVDQGETNAGAP